MYFSLSSILSRQTNILRCKIFIIEIIRRKLNQCASVLLGDILYSGAIHHIDIQRPYAYNDAAEELPQLLSSSVGKPVRPATESATDLRPARATLAPSGPCCQRPAV